MRHGFTVIELIVVFTIIAILGGLVSLNLLSVQRGASLSAVSEQLLADIAHTRLRALSGTDANSSGNDHGVYLETSQYTVFTGSVYTAADPQNTVFLLPDNIQLTAITIPSSTLIFSQGSGEIASFVEGSNSFSIVETNSNSVRNITFNKVGTIIANDYE